jgi:hypothetical protein
MPREAADLPGAEADQIQIFSQGPNAAQRDFFGTHQAVSKTVYSLP